MFRLVVAAMYGFLVLLIPQYLVMRQLGILNTYAGLILRLAFSALGIFLAQQSG